MGYQSTVNTVRIFSSDFLKRQTTFDYIKVFLMQEGACSDAARLASVDTRLLLWANGKSLSFK